MKKVNFYLLITALLLIVVGTVCMINPGESFQAMAWLIGLLVLLAGGISLLFGIRAKETLPNSSFTRILGIIQLVVGLLFVVIGILFVSDSEKAATVLTVIFALWVMVEGLMLAVLSFNYKKGGYKQWWIMLLLGVISLLLGLLAVCHPSWVGVFFGILLGAGIFANGVERIVAFTALKAIENTVRDLEESANATPIDNKQQ